MRRAISALVNSLLASFSDEPPPSATVAPANLGLLFLGERSPSLLSGGQGGNKRTLLASPMCRRFLVSPLLGAKAHMSPPRCNARTSHKGLITSSLHLTFCSRHLVQLCLARVRLRDARGMPRCSVVACPSGSIEATASETCSSSEPSRVPNRVTSELCCFRYNCFRKLRCKMWFLTVAKVGNR